MGTGDTPTGRSAQPAHEIRRFESAVWSLYVLSENPALPLDARAACRAAADHAALDMTPGDDGVTALIQLVIEVGGGEKPVPREQLLGRLRQSGWVGDPTVLDKEPPPLVYPPPRNIVSDQLRSDALDKILSDIERHVKDPKMPPDQRQSYGLRLAELRASPADMRSKTERAWALLGVIERNREAREAKKDSQA